MDQNQLKGFSAEFLKKYEKHEEYYDLGGDFLPLSVLKTQGFDIDDIVAKALPEDKRPCRMFGTVYRPPIYSAGKRGTQGTAHEQSDNKNQKRKIDGDKPEKSISSSSSSSSSRHKSKKSKKRKSSKKRHGKGKGAAEKKKSHEVRKKEEEQVRKMAAKAAEKNANTNTKLAENLAPIVAEAKMLLSSCLSHSHFANLPQGLKDAAHKQHELITSYSKDISKVLGGEASHQISSWLCLKDSKQPIADAKRTASSVGQMLSVSSKFS